MKYIGVRTSDKEPHLDTHYWGSSKHTPKDIESTHKKRILKIFNTREEAIAHEIMLHNKYDVGVNPMFYNRAKQTSTKFDTSGISCREDLKEYYRAVHANKIVSEHTRAKMRKAFKGRVYSEQARKNMSEGQKRYCSRPDYVHPNKGKPVSEAARLKARLARKQSGKSVGTNNVKFKAWFIMNTITGVKEEFYDITKEDYAKLHNIPMSTLKASIYRSKGVKVLKRGKFTGCILGNVEVKTL
jgi:hypothetical protein